MRIPLLAANWKMFKTVHETVAFLREFTAQSKTISGVEIVVAPPFTALAAAAEIARNSNVCIAAQNLYFEREGAFTGEVSAAMIKDTGATHVIVGHSERRRIFGDTDEWVHRKTRAAIAADLTPIVCIGETLAEREAGETLTVLDRQIRAAFDGLGADQIGAPGDRVRAGVGHRHRQERHAGGGGRSPSAHPRPPAPMVWRRGGRPVPHPLRRIGETRQHP